MKKLYMAGLCLCATFAPVHPTSAHDNENLSRPDAHAPIGVMRDHVHNQGEWMLSYRYEYMHMAGNRDGDSSVSTADVLNDFMVAPTEMPMHMHMIGAMYGLTDDVTLSVMGGFMEKDMDHIRRNGTTFKRDNQGITDTKISALYEFYNDGKHRFQFNGGISLPTGDVNDRKADGTIFAYPMQMGSGTYDLLPGISYSGLSDQWSWGAQANSTLRLGSNNRDYTLGDNYQLTVWGARKINEILSVSLRLDGKAWDNVDGRERELQGPNFMAPPADPDRQAGERLDALVGFNFIVPSGTLKGNRFAAEFGAPVYQHLDGPRIETDYKLTLGWQYAF
jgi:hypothetical protein